MFDYSETDEATFRAIINDVESERDSLRATTERDALRSQLDEAVKLLQRAAGIHAPNTPWTVKETVLSWGAWYRDFLAFRSSYISHGKVE